MQPLPPSPAFTRILASSINIVQKEKPRPEGEACGAGALARDLSIKRN
jgi:hypothetical protein